VISDVLVAILRLAHALAAALWVGGTLTFALVDRSAQGRLSSASWRGFREALRAGIGVFVATGAILTLERLSSAPLPPTYFAVLGTKVLLGIWMFFLARQIGAGSLATGRAWWSTPEARILGLGVVIYGLAIALKSIYEDTIRFRG
jgi:putative copper export protein